MKICHFLPWFSPATKGGTEVYILHLSRLLEQEGNEVIIVCPSDSNSAQEFQVSGINVIATPLLPLQQHWRVDQGVDPPDCLAEFRVLLVKLNPDVLHFHCFWRRHIFYLEMAGSLGIRTFVTPHLALFSCMQTQLLEENIKPCDGKVELHKCTRCLLTSKVRNRQMGEILTWLNLAATALPFPVGEGTKVSRLFNVGGNVQNHINVLKRVNRSVDGVIAISQWYYSVLENTGLFLRSQLTLIPTAMEGAYNATPYKASGRSLSIGFVGRQSVEKGIHLLLKAVEALPKGSVAVHLFGEEVDATVQKEVARLQRCGHSIIQHGLTAHLTVIKSLSRLDVVCVPSTSIEMSPLVIHEAISLGIPVIGSDRGGIPDLVEEGVNGFLFQNNNWKALAGKIGRLVENRELLNELRNHCKSIVDARMFTKAHLQLYKGAMTGLAYASKKMS